MSIGEITTRADLVGKYQEEWLSVSVILACRNEQRYIALCLDSILANDYPKDRLEILVIDGMSTDSTREIVKEFARLHSNLRLLDNPIGSFPAAMNIGIRNSRASLVVIAGAHAVYQSDHISSCVRYHQESGAENVGGVVHIEPGADSTLAHAIAAALASRFGSGNAHVKTGVQQPMWADTAAFGCYRRELFNKIGMFDERLLGSSDFDLNRRLTTAGGRILLVPGIVVRYFADATWSAFWRHNFADGFCVTYILKFGSKAWSFRHWIPPLFVASLFGALAVSFVWGRFLWMFLAILSVYVFVNLGFSASISIRERMSDFMLLLPGIFVVRHSAFGLGALYGLLLLPLPKFHWRGRRTERGQK